MTKTEDDWSGTAIEKQIHDSTHERMQRSGTPKGQSPVDCKGDISKAVAEVEKQLTGDLPAMIRLLREHRARPVTNRVELRVNQAVCERIGSHVHEMQQGGRPPVVDGNAARYAAVLHNSTAGTKRALEIVRLKLVEKLVVEDVFAPILADSVSRLPDSHKNISRTPREVLLADSNCRDQLNALLALAVAAQIEKLERFPLTNVADRIIELKQLLSATTDTDEVPKIQAELNTLRAPEAEDIASRNRRKVTEKRELAQDVANGLIAWTLRSLEAMLSEALAFERAMFADLHLATEETVVSRRYKQAIAELQHPKTSEQVLRWYGMPSLTYVAEQLEQSPT